MSKYSPFVNKSLYFILDNSDKTYSKDIVKNETYKEDIYAIAIPLTDSIGIMTAKAVL